MELMIKYSSGMPTMMQHIGDAVYWGINDDHITKKDALMGILRAGEIIGLKYLQPILDKRIRSKNYLSLFKKMGYELAAKPDSPFTKNQFQNILNDNELKVFNDFIRRARKLNIIELSGSKKKGEYRFTNQLYPIYFFILTINDQENLY